MILSGSYHVSYKIGCHTVEIFDSYTWLNTSPKKKLFIFPDIANLIIPIIIIFSKDLCYVPSLSVTIDWCDGQYLKFRF